MSHKQQTTNHESPVTNHEPRITRNWAWPSELRRAGVIGINTRNLEHILPRNPRRLYPLVDNKARTKRLCAEENLPVPETFSLIERFGDIHRFPKDLGDRAEFVVKPAAGAEGRGVLVVVAREEDDAFVLSDGRRLGLSEMRYHLSTTWSGLYSLGGRPDQVIIEERVRPHSVFREIAFQGTPDIRVILTDAWPVMAMIRLPTRASRGRANLFQGAVGAGINLETGRTLGGVCRSRTIDRHPDSGAPLAGFEIPEWEAIPAIATRLARATGLGYLGVDIVLDETRGPVILEANARPGLAIQLANRQGLQRVLDNSVDVGRANA